MSFISYTSMCFCGGAIATQSMAAKPKIRATFMLEPATKQRLAAASEKTGRSALHITETALNRYLDVLEQQEIK